jgi:flagellar motor protein MotB
MRLRNLNESEIDVWPAFTDFLTSVLIIVVIFVFGVFFSNIARSLVRRNSEFEQMQTQQATVRWQLLSQLKESVEVTEDGSLQRITLRVDEQGGGGVLFPSGSATLSEPGKKLLLTIADVLTPNRDLYDKIQVEGHTDDVPVGGKYASNWELSAARAGAVVDYILDESARRQAKGLEPWRFSANGAAEYHPYNVPEAKMSQTQAANQRGGPPLDYVVRANQTTNADALFDNPARQRNRRIEIVLTYRVKTASGASGAR